MLNFKWYTFSDLSTDLLYDILALRNEVFVLGQHCIYQDADGWDKVSLHLLGTDNNTPAAYLRLFPPTETENHVSFGRVLTAPAVRQKGYGKLLIKEMLNYCDKHFPGLFIHCSAQHYLLEFYQHLGFTPHGEIYNEEGIPHIAMMKC